MRIAIPVKNIHPNPFRKGGLDPARINLLVEQIDKDKGGTSFWDNLLLRQHPTKQGCWQLAYGHHRIEALKRLGYKEIESAVKDLSDADMVKIMADENLREAEDPDTILTTVQAARDYLQAALDKSSTAAEWSSVVNLLHSNDQGFGKMKAEGIGLRTITAFLGKRWESRSGSCL